MPWQLPSSELSGGDPPPRGACPDRQPRGGRRGAFLCSLCSSPAGVLGGRMLIHRDQLV